MKIKLTDTVSYWHYTWETTNITQLISYAINISNKVKSNYDSYNLWSGNKSKEWVKSQNFGVIEELILTAVSKCEGIHALPYNSTKFNVWVNMIAKLNPKQIIREGGSNTLIYHSHAELEAGNGNEVPDYTFVCYLQMPDNLKEDDGKLFIKDKNNNEIGFLPKVGDLIILKGDTHHSPVDAPYSTKDRIVIAGNVCLQTLKTEKTLL